MSDYVHVVNLTDANESNDPYSNPWTESEESESKRLEEEARENEQALMQQEWEQESLLIDQLTLELQTLRKVTIELISEKDRVIEQMKRDKETWFSNESKEKADARARLQQKRIDSLRRFLAEVLRNTCPFEDL